VVDAAARDAAAPSDQGGCGRDRGIGADAPQGLPRLSDTVKLAMLLGEYLHRIWGNLPSGIMLIGRHFADGEVLQVAAAFEELVGGF
jgi:Asp-tRNA(Asn)/Glu-tRNA(Gln) amidotransferase A subunit family amidase